MENNTSHGDYNATHTKEEEILGWSILLGIDCINTILHVVGISLLSHLYRGGERRPQTMYLLNLSCTELALSIFAIPIGGIGLSRLLVGKIDENVYNFLYFTAHTGVIINITCAMFLLTGDRMLSIMYGVRYSAYWTRTKTLVAIMITWVVTVTTSAVLGVLVLIYGKTAYLDKIYWLIVLYITPSLNALYLILAIIVYSTMLIKLVKSRKRFRNSSSSSSTSSCSTTCNLFFHSKFSVSILIISSYLLFTVGPNITGAVWLTAFPGVLGRPYQFFRLFYYISIRFSCTIDAQIYIFLHPKIKELIRNIFCPKKKSESPIKLPSAVRRARENAIQPKLEKKSIDCDPEPKDTIMEKYVIEFEQRIDFLEKQIMFDRRLIEEQHKTIRQLIDLPKEQQRTKDSMIEIPKGNRSTSNKCVAFMDHYTTDNIIIHNI